MPTYFAPIDQRVVNRALKETGFDGLPLAIISLPKPKMFAEMPERLFLMGPPGTALLVKLALKSLEGPTTKRSLVLTSKGLWFRDWDGDGWSANLIAIDRILMGRESNVWSENSAWTGEIGAPTLEIFLELDGQKDVLRFQHRSLGYTSTQSAEEDFIRIIQGFQEHKFWNHLHLHIQTYDEETRSYWLILTSFHGEPLLDEFEWCADYSLSDSLTKNGLRNSAEHSERCRDFLEVQLHVAGAEGHVENFLSEPMVDFPMAKSAPVNELRTV